MGDAVSARERWGAYVDSLPWATAEDVAFANTESFLRDGEARIADARILTAQGTLSVPPAGEELPWRCQWRWA